MRIDLKLAAPIAALLFFSGVVAAAAPELDRARKLYNSTDFDQSLKILLAMPEKDAAVDELIGLNYFGLTDYKKATDYLEKAVAAEPNNASHVLWLARAYGRRAETSSVFTAPGLASKSHQYFEKAVQLDPKNLDALNDLLDYYLEAPGFLGGGLDRAEALVPRLAAVNPVDADGALSRIAEKRKEYSSAEAHLRRATELAPQSIGNFIALARLMVRQGRFQEADQSMARAEKIAPNSPRVVYAKADLFIKSNRNLDQAQQLLERYMSLSLTPDDPPRSEARKLLKKVRGT